MEGGELCGTPWLTFARWQRVPAMVWTSGCASGGLTLWEGGWVSVRQ